MCASTPNIEPETIPVAVGIVVDREQRVLVTRRPDHKHQGGKWEFPGGKIETGESMPAALHRELHEELGIVVRLAQPLVRVRHRYPEKCVYLDVWRVRHYDGQPHGREGQPLQWVAPSELERLALPDADRPIIRALQLPPVYLISAAGRLGTGKFLKRLERLCRLGGFLLQLREPQLRLAEFRRLARQVLEVTQGSGVRVLVNAEPELAAELGADGVHLNGRRLMAATGRPLPPPWWVAASCHNDRELAQAGHVGADFTVLSPVLPTRSHPGSAALGWDRFRSLRLAADMPVYALGGMEPQHLGIADAAGAQGVAMLSAVWDSPVPEQVIAALTAG